MATTLSGVPMASPDPSFAFSPSPSAALRNATAGSADSSSVSMRWEAGLIVISYLCAFQASYTAIQILQMRINVWLIAVAAFCFAVSGIWAMHFVGMAAMHVHADVTYDLGWTIASILFAYFPCFGAFWSLDHKLVHLKLAKKQRVIDAQRRAEGLPVSGDDEGDGGSTNGSHNQPLVEQQDGDKNNSSRNALMGESSRNSNRCLQQRRRRTPSPQKALGASGGARVGIGLGRSALAAHPSAWDKPSPRPIITTNNLALHTNDLQQQQQQAAFSRHIQIAGSSCGNSPQVSNSANVPAIDGTQHNTSANNIQYYFERSSNANDFDPNRVGGGGGNGGGGNATDSEMSDAAHSGAHSSSVVLMRAMAPAVSNLAAPSMMLLMSGAPASTPTQSGGGAVFGRTPSVNIITSGNNSSTNYVKASPLNEGREPSHVANCDVSTTATNTTTGEHNTSPPLPGRRVTANRRGFLHESMATTSTSTRRSQNYIRDAANAAAANNNSSGDEKDHYHSTIAEEEAMLEDTRDISLRAHMAAFREAPHVVLLCGGALIALGACLMHYLGMHAMSMPGAVRVMDGGVIVASCIIALIAGTAALYFAFIFPSTREYTIPTAIIAAAAVSGMHYVGMYGIRYEYPAGSDHAMEMGMNMMHGTDGESSIEPFIIYIIFASSAISSASLALSSYFYRRSLQKAADEAEQRARLIMAGKFDELGSVGGKEDTSRLDPIMARLRISNAKLGEQMRKLRSFLPASLLAQFEQQEGFTSAEEDDAESDGDDEGSLQLAVSIGRSGRDAQLMSCNSLSGAGGSTHRSVGAGSPNTANAPSPVGKAAAFAKGGPPAGDVPAGSTLLTRIDTLPNGQGAASGFSRSTDATTTTLGATIVNHNSNNKQQSPTAGNKKDSHQHHNGRQQYALSLQSRTIAVLSLNCHGFTRTFEHSPHLMGDYADFIDGLCHVAKQQRGVMDIVHGDRVIMTFNASLRNASYGRSAATAAVHIAKDVGAPSDVACVAIGVATGAARLGNMGSKQMMKYNVCGPVFGNAVRAMHFASALHGSHGVHVAGFITDDMRIAVRTRALDIVHFKSMAQPAIISEIVSSIASGSADEWMYELETSSGNDPFAVINKTFTTVLEYAKRSNAAAVSGVALLHSAGMGGGGDLGGGVAQWPPPPQQLAQPPSGAASPTNANNNNNAASNSISFVNASSLMRHAAGKDDSSSVNAMNGNNHNTTTISNANNAANVVVVAPSLCHNCSSLHSRRTLGDVIAQAEHTLAMIDARSREVPSLHGTGPDFVC